MKRHFLGLGAFSVLAAPSWSAAQVAPAAAGARVIPFRAIAVTTIGGRLVPASPWIRISPRRDAGNTRPAFDAFGAGPTGEPAGFCDSGCTQNGWCPSSQPNVRWWGGLNFRSPMSTNDMTVAPALAGRAAIRTQFAWWWAHSAPTRCYVAILTGSNFTTCPTSTPPASGDLGGVVFDFGELTESSGYWWSDIDARGTGLSWLLPASGSYTVMLGTSYDAGTATFTVDQAWGTQPMRWGTGDRAGSSGPMQWDDWRNASGTLEWNECSYYDDIHHCPTPEGAMLAFWVDTSCYANCDGSSGSPSLTSNDFQCFINAFAAGLASANCDGSTGTPSLTANDFQCFINAFAAGCP